MSRGPAWKVPYSNKKSPEGYTLHSTVEEVQNALPKDVEGMEVTDGGRGIHVFFPDGVSNETMQKVKRHLQDQGFEVS